MRGLLFLKNENFNGLFIRKTTDWTFSQSYSSYATKIRNPKILLII